MRIANYSELRKNLESYIDKVSEDRDVLFVHRSGNKSVVVISLEEYNTIKETIMQSLAING